MPIQGNSERCLVLRQQYSLKMLALLEEGTRIINIDESWLNDTNFTRKIWCPADAPATITQRAVTPRLTLIAALDTEGRLYFTLTHANTDSDVLLAFMKHLMRQLDSEDPDWQEKMLEDLTSEQRAVLEPPYHKRLDRPILNDDGTLASR